MPRRSAPSQSHVLSEIISTVASTLELDEVLRAVVRLLSEASAVHACFVYLVEDEGERLVLRAASEPYAPQVGRIALQRGAGIAWWAAEHREPVLIRDEALADPRFEYVPELAEERFQSLVSVPILARAGMAIGAITMHTEAPREFTAAEIDFLVSSASLVAGAIENARLYAETRRRVAQLELLNGLAETIARASTREELLDAVASSARGLLRARSCIVYLLDPGGGRLDVAARSPGTADAGSLDPVVLTRALRGRGRREEGVLRAAIVSGDAPRGLIELRAPDGGQFGTDDDDLARTAASQAALALEKLELIDRLTERNAITDLFEDLAAGRRESATERAARLDVDLTAPHVVLAAAGAPGASTDPHWANRLQAALARAAPGALFDRRDDRLRGLLPLAARTEETLVGAVRAARDAVDAPIAVGLSSACADPDAFRAGFEEAAHALLGATVLPPYPATRTFSELGPYRYLLRLAGPADERDHLRRAIERLAAYDRERSSSLLDTLGEYLHRRGSVTATSDALFVHPNTLRQRLRRIAELTGLDLDREDWLALEIAVRLVALEHGLAR